VIACKDMVATTAKQHSLAQKALMGNFVRMADHPRAQQEIVNVIACKDMAATTVK